MSPRTQGVFVLLWWAGIAMGTDITYLDRLQEKDIAAVFNKVAYGGVTTTKRSISSKYLSSSGSQTTVAPPFTSISVPNAPPHSVTLPTTHLTTPSREGNPVTTLPPFAAPRTLFPPSFTTPSSREVPSYIPPIRSFFTPPLPPEYANPFANKPTLRGSNSDGVHSVGRRPIPPAPPPPPPPRPSTGRERIPLRPPDLAPSFDRESAGPGSVDRKKPLNTPSFNRSPDSPYSEVDISGANARPSNDSDFDFVPMLQYPSVSRILSGSNGRKQDVPDVFHRPDVPRVPEVYPNIDLDASVARTAKKDIPQTLAKPEAESPHTAKPVAVLEQEKEEQGEEEEEEGRAEQLPDPQPQPPKPEEPAVEVADTDNPSRNNLRSKSRLAWDVHVYLTASLFALLALYSAVNVVRVNACKRLLSRSYYVALHGLLLTVGAVRSVYLFYDAYNLNGSFPASVSHLLLNVVSPLITSAFIILFLFLVLAAKVNIVSLHLQRPALVGVMVLFHVVLCVSLDLATGVSPDTTSFLPLICQCVFIVLCLCLGVAYLYVYKPLSKAAARKQDNVFGSGFTNIYRPTLATAVRATLATALLSLLMAAVQLYGIFGVFEVLNFGDKNVPWLWWGYQFSVRVIEISMCFLLSWAGVQPLRQSSVEEEKESHNSGFALFRCGQCANTPQSSETADDIYPAVCVTNQAIHDYTVRTGKKVYDDSFPLNNLHTSFPIQDSNFPLSTSERRSLRKAGYPAAHDVPYAMNGTGTSDRRSVKKSGTFDAERPEFDLPFSTNEIRRSLKNSGTLISLNSERPTSTAERRSLRRAGAVEVAEGRRSLKKSGTLASLGPDRRVPPPQHRGGTQTLASTRERTSPSMLVDENGFVRFRALAEPEEQATVEEIVGR